jgi:hypothetical protein
VPIRANPCHPWFNVSTSLHLCAKRRCRANRGAIARFRIRRVGKLALFCQFIFQRFRFQIFSFFFNPCFFIHLTRSLPLILPFGLPLAVYRAAAQPPGCAHPWLKIFPLKTRPQAQVSPPVSKTPSAAPLARPRKTPFQDDLQPKNRAGKTSKADPAAKSVANEKNPKE